MTDSSELRRFTYRLIWVWNTEEDNEQSVGHAKPQPLSYLALSVLVWLLAVGDGGQAGQVEGGGGRGRQGGQQQQRQVRRHGDLVFYLPLGCGVCAICVWGTNGAPLANSSGGTGESSQMCSLLLPSGVRGGRDPRRLSVGRGHTWGTLGRAREAGGLGGGLWRGDHHDGQVPQGFFLRGKFYDSNL